MKTVYIHKERISRFIYSNKNRSCYKFVPIKYVFKCSIEDFKVYAKKLVEEYFPKDRTVAVNINNYKKVVFMVQGSIHC